MSKNLVPALLLLAVVVSALKKQCAAHPSYTQQALSLSWPGDFCGNPGNCIKAYDKQWDGKSFGIHGLWPSYDSADLTCVMNGKNPDPFCDYKYYFNGNLLKTLEKSLQTLWPQWGKTNYDSFHKDQWNKHGVCYLKLLKEKYPAKKYSDDQLFKAYFQDSLTWAQRHNKVTKFTFKTKAELARQLKIYNPNTFYVACNNWLIFEVRLCLAIAEIGNEKPVQCFARDLQAESIKCQFPLRLKQKAYM